MKYFDFIFDFFVEPITLGIFTLLLIALILFAYFIIRILKITQIRFNSLLRLKFIVIYFASILLLLLVKTALLSSFNPYESIIRKECNYFNNEMEKPRTIAIDTLLYNKKTDINTNLHSICY